jgi:hypothetical protein
VKNSAIRKNASILAACGIDNIASLKEMIWLNEMTLLEFRMMVLDVMELNLEEMK